MWSCGFRTAVLAGLVRLLVLTAGVLVKGGGASRDLVDDVLLIVALIAFQFPAPAFVDPQGKAFFVPGLRFAPVLRCLCSGNMARGGQRRIGASHSGVSRSEPAAHVAIAGGFRGHGAEGRERFSQDVHGGRRLARLHQNLGDCVVGKAEVRPGQRVVRIGGKQGLKSVVGFTFRGQGFAKFALIPLKNTQLEDCFREIFAQRNASGKGGKVPEGGRPL